MRWHFVIVSLMLFPMLGPSVAGEEVKEKSKPRFTIGKETTHVTGPRAPDGRIDYVAALNDRLSKGVKPTENAAAALCLVIGPRPEGSRMSPAFYKRLGIEEPPLKGEYLRDAWQFARERLKLDLQERGQELLEQSDKASAQPWTGPQFPILSQCLEANENALILAHEATRLPKYYYPLLPPGRGEDENVLFYSLVPGVQKCRSLCQELTMRSMLHLGEGRTEEAWQDLLACHRLARVVARGGTLIEILVGIAIDHIASGADLVFLEHARLDSDQLKRCLRDLQSLPPMPGLADKVDIFERYAFLNAVMTVDRKGIGFIDELAFLTQRQALGFLPEEVGEIAWDPGLRNANRWYDRLASALREKDRSKRVERSVQLKNEQEKRRAKLAKPEAMTTALADAGTSPEERGRILTELILALMADPIPKVQAASDRRDQILRNLHVAFALAAYQSDHGRYPETLKAVAPKYLAGPPKDLFSGKDLIYRPAKTGYLLYSVGANGVDEGGRSFGDDPAGDDLRVLMRGRKGK